MVRSILGVSMVLLLPVAAEANPLRWLFCPRPVTAYYYPPTVVYYRPAVAVAYPCPIVVAPVRVTPAPAVGEFAVPRPAPASRPNEPPMAPAPIPAPQPVPASPINEPPLASPPAPQPAPAPVPLPQTGELRFYDAYAAGPATARAEGRVSVNFWNLSDRDHVLVAGGQRFLLQRNRSATLQLDRQFVWQVEGRPALPEQVPAGESALAIVIRR